MTFEELLAENRFLRERIKELEQENTRLKTLCPIESDPLVLRAEPSIECRLERFLVLTACISNSDERKG